MRIAYYLSGMQYNQADKRRYRTWLFRLDPTKKESENKTIRFPLSLIERIDDAIKDNDVTFSAFVIQACEYALDNMEPESPKP